MDEEIGDIPDPDGYYARQVREIIQLSLNSALPPSNFHHISEIDFPFRPTAVPRINRQRREIEIGPPRSHRAPDGILTGFNDLDRIVGGLRAGEIIAIAGLPSSGSSTLVQNIARRIATGAVAGSLPNAPGKVVAFYNLDIPNSQMVERLIGAEAKFDFSTRVLRADDELRLATAREKLTDTKLILTDNRHVSLDDIYDTWMGRKERTGLDLIVLDRVNVLGVDLGGIAPPLRETMTELKYIAEDMGVPILVTYTADPMMADEETHQISPVSLPSAIQACSDVLAFIHRPDHWILQNYLENRDDSNVQVPIPEPQKGLEVGELHVARQKGGSPDTMRFVMNSRWGRIDNVIWD